MSAELVGKAPGLAGLPGVRLLLTRPGRLPGK